MIQDSEISGHNFVLQNGTGRNIDLEQRTYWCQNKLMLQKIINQSCLVKVASFTSSYNRPKSDSKKYHFIF